METKLAMCYEHKSQIEWMNANYKDTLDENSDFFKNVIITNKFRGMQCGVEYAEAFVMAKDGYRRGKTNGWPMIRTGGNDGVHGQIKGLCAGLRQR